MRAYYRDLRNHGDAGPLFCVSIRTYFLDRTVNTLFFLRCPSNHHLLDNCEGIVKRNDVQTSCSLLPVETPGRRFNPLYPIE